MRATVQRFGSTLTFHSKTCSVIGFPTFKVLLNKKVLSTIEGNALLGRPLAFLGFTTYKKNCVRCVF